MLVGIVAIHAATIMILLFEWLSPSGFNMKVNPSDAAQKLLVLLLISLLISYPRFPFHKEKDTRNYLSRQWSLIWTKRVTIRFPVSKGKEIDRHFSLSTFPRQRTLRLLLPILLLFLSFFILFSMKFPKHSISFDVASVDQEDFSLGNFRWEGIKK